MSYFWNTREFPILENEACKIFFLAKGFFPPSIPTPMTIRHFYIESGPCFWRWMTLGHWQCLWNPCSFEICPFYRSMILSLTSHNFLFEICALLFNFSPASDTVNIRKLKFFLFLCKFCIKSLFTLNMRGPSYLGLTRSISWLLMPWLLTSPGHLQPWYWLYSICRSFSYLRKCFKYLCQINVEEWHKMQIYVYVPSEKFST